MSKSLTDVPSFGEQAAECAMGGHDLIFERRVVGVTRCLPLQQGEQPLAMPKRLIERPLTLTRLGEPCKCFTQLIAIIAIARLGGRESLNIGKPVLEGC